MIGSTYLAPDGVWTPSRLLYRTVSSYLTISPSPPKALRVGWLFVSVPLSLALRPPRAYILDVCGGQSYSVVPGLSSPMLHRGTVLSSKAPKIYHFLLKMSSFLREQSFDGEF